MGERRRTGEEDAAEHLLKAFATRDAQSHVHT